MMQSLNSTRSSTNRSPHNPVDSLLMTIDGTQSQPSSSNAPYRLHVYLIPGNPGLPIFYDTFITSFLDKVRDHLGLACYFHSISHMGHTTKSSDRLYSLDDQIANHRRYLHQSVLPNLRSPEDRLVLIGHSIGAYIMLKLLADLASGGRSCTTLSSPDELLAADGASCTSPTSLFAHADEHSRVFAIGLFPTIERMVTSSNGRRHSPWFHRPLSWLAIFVVALFYCLIPQRLKRSLVRRFISNPAEWTQPPPSCVVEGACTLLRPSIVRQVLYMADTEMRQVGPSSAVDHMLASLPDRGEKCLTLIYSETDQWTPKEYWQELKQRCPHVDARMYSEQQGFEHAFVMRHNDEIAKLCVELLRDKFDIPTPVEKICHDS